MDISTPENIATSAKNVVKNTLVSAENTLEKTLDTIAETTEKFSPKKRTRRSAPSIQPSAVGATDVSILINGPTAAMNNSILNYEFVVSNAGPSDAHGTNLKITLPEGLRNIKLKCQDVTNGAVCPDEESFTDSAVEINKALVALPVNSSAKFILTAKLPISPPSSVNFTAEITVPAGMTEINDRSNQAQINTEITTGTADVAVTQLTSHMPDNMQPRVQIADAERYTKEIVFDNPQPVTYTVRYENKGPGFADGARINFGMKFSDFNDGNKSYYGGNTKMEYSDFRISCQASAGAVCPDEYTYDGSYKFPENGFVRGDYYYSVDAFNFFTDTKIPQFNPKGYIDVTITFTPKKVTMLGGSELTCYDRKDARFFQPYNVTIRNDYSIRDTDDNNNNGTREEILRGNIHALPNIDQICPAADLAVSEVRYAGPTKIVTTPEVSENGFGQNLKVDTPEKISFTVKYENI